MAIYYKTKEARDRGARQYAEQDQDTVLCELWSEDHTQDALNQGWACDDSVVPGWFVYVVHRRVGDQWEDVSPATPDRDKALEWTTDYRRTNPGVIAGCGWRRPVPGEPGITVVRIENRYRDGVNITTLASLETPQDDEDIDDWFRDTVSNAAGPGRTDSVEAVYMSTVMSSDRPGLIGRTFDSKG